jgi:thymidylate synthase
MYLRADILDDLLKEAFELVISKGKATEASRGRTLEVIGVLLELENPRARLSRSETKGRPFSCLGELLWYLSGTDKLEFIERYIPAYVDDAEDDGTLHGAYGPRLYDMDGQNQIANVTNLLRENPGSRRAVIQLYSAQDIAKRYNEIPCTTTIQYLLRDGRLDCCVTMRSNDAFKGLPHDTFCFTMIQELIARDLGVEIGVYKHFAGSFHLYEDSINGAQQYLTEGYHSSLAMPPMPPGSQWLFVQQLLAVEDGIRRGEGEAAMDPTLPPYWQDLSRLLLAFEQSGDPDAIGALAAQMSSDVYRSYMERRKTTRRPRSGTASR